MKGMQQVETLRAACCVVGVDGKASEAEMRIIKSLAAEVGVGEASLTAMLERAKSDKEFYDEQFKILKTDPKETMQLMFSLALADGSFRKDEHFILQQFAERLGVSEAQFNQWTQQALEYLKSKRGDNSAGE